MPSETFLNLRKDKQNRLLDAALFEFSKHLLEDVSINQIIKNAGISRGSFYMYFEDKEDLYGYLLNRYKDELYQSIFSNLKKNNGDFIEAWKDIFADILHFCEHTKHKDFFKNIFLNLRLGTENKLELKPSIEERKACKEKLLEEIDRTYYKIETEEELMDAFRFIMMITNMSIVYTFMNPEKAEEEKLKYENRLKWFQNGIYKEEEKRK